MFSSYFSQNILRPLPPISPILSLKDHRRLEDFDRMPCAGGNLHADAQARQCQEARRSTSAATYPPENFGDRGSCEDAATPLRTP